MDKKKVEKEHKRLVEILEKAEVPNRQREVLSAVIDNMAWQRIKLDETRAKMQEEDIIIPYKNGKDQEGTHVNPIFKAYTDLWRSYMVGLEKYTSYLPKEYHEEVIGDTLSVLEQVKKMKRSS